MRKYGKFRINSVKRNLTRAAFACLTTIFLGSCFQSLHANEVDDANAFIGRTNCLVLMIGNNQDERGKLVEIQGNFIGNPPKKHTYDFIKKLYDMYFKQYARNKDFKGVMIHSSGNSTLCITPLISGRHLADAPEVSHDAILRIALELKK